MLPALIWSAWGLLKGSEKTMPSELVVIPFIVCLILYWFLIQLGRVSSSVNSTEAEEQTTLLAEKPPALLPEKVLPRPIDKVEEANLKDCFPWSVYYLQEIECRPQAVICRGHLRSQPEVAYRTIRENVEGLFGDRFYVVFQLGANNKPFFALVTNPQAQQNLPKQTKDARPVLALTLFAITLGTTTLAWLQITNRLQNFSWQALISGLPYALALLTILGIHELGHYLMTRQHQVQATLPYFIPILPLPLFPFGTFGAFIQTRSPIPNRKALFDISITGPFCGFLVALPLLLWGLAHSQVVTLPEQSTPFNLQAFNPRFSLLISLASKWMLGAAIGSGKAINLHPVAVAGVLGMIVTAFNLMPVGQLDGGHITHALFGQRRAATIGQVVRVLLFVLSLSQPHLMVWAIFLFLLPANDEPTLNDVTELDNQRYFLGLLAPLLLLLIILPTSATIERWLGL
jgi:membrane-associated protease RseP (regulator of RpoE activity)